ncbi:hypothetical protein HW090_03295 [Pseudomonas sp. ABC1]|uniref:hypothetical protein n=1 Tax=Pseudomonas sp. ABC1 TaxID=2748080 RepID=UPI0015C33DD1|nr:hypothetical protein [Pseudomonas sp. ABC1]QLF92279.1 hypothetical protein HW090_03295 [Pseudomonas sp. ABC1]
MTNKKIQDNPSYVEVRNLVNGVEVFECLYNLIPQLREKYPGFQGVFDELSKSKIDMDAPYIPDGFNKRFSAVGWIAYESMPIDIAREAIRIHDETGISCAEKYLANAYDEAFLDWASRGFHYPEAFASRLRLINLAKVDYLNERYHACVPLLLILLDGIVNDVTKSIGFFASSTDLTAWDSVAAHSSGLQVLASLFSKGRFITTEEEITIPYRNGILHGRDLVFDNKLVSAKCWAALFAIKDWADSVIEGKKSPPKSKDDLSLLELIERKEKREVVKKLFQEWLPRQPNELSHLPVSEGVGTIPQGTPELTLWSFLESWKNKRYGLMAEVLRHCLGEPRGKCAGDVKNDYSKLNLASFNIVSLIDTSPSVSVLKTILRFPEKDVQLDIHLSYVDRAGYSCVRSCAGGQWLILQNSLGSILYPQY